MKTVLKFLLISEILVDIRIKIGFEMSSISFDLPGEVLLDWCARASHLGAWRRYLRSYKKNHAPETRQIISVIRRNELITLDISDVDLVNCTVRLKKTAKRSNGIVFFDQETKAFLEKYLATRKGREKALFVGRQCGYRITRNQVYDVLQCSWNYGLHDPNGRLDQKFGPHCCRDWFTTWLRRSGISRNFIQELREDSRKDAIDVYDHIGLDELKDAYLRHIPQMKVKPEFPFCII